MTHPHQPSDDRPWHEHDLLIIDFETTGLSPDNDMPIELGAVLIHEGKVETQFETFIDPGRDVPEFITKLTGITDEMVKGAPVAREAFQKLLDEIPYGDVQPVAYNAPFDKPWWFKHLPATSRQIPLLNPEHTWLDPLVMVRHLDRYVKGNGRHKLEVTADRWGVQLEGAHRASGDCLMTWRLLEKMIADKKLPMHFTMAELLIRQESRRREQDAERKSYRSKKP